MGLYRHLKHIWRRPRANLGKAFRDKLVQFRREPATLRIHRPTNLMAARSRGYKAKQGIILVRQRVPRGGHEKPARAGGRRSKRMSPRMTLAKNYQTIAEERANKNFRNCEVLNSYFAAKDGKNFWYEIILIDRNHPVVQSDKQLSGIARQRGRVFRGKTSSARKSRGLRRKGKGAEKARPSRRSNVAISRKNLTGTAYGKKRKK